MKVDVDKCTKREIENNRILKYEGEETELPSIVYICYLI